MGMGRLILTRLTWRDCAVRAAEFTVAGSLGLALAMIQVLPFLEYLLNSTMWTARSGQHQIPFFRWPLVVLRAFPDLLGNPSHPSFESFGALGSFGTNYNEHNGSYVGLLVLFTAGLSVLMWRRHRSPHVLFFAVMAVIWVAYAYNVAGFGSAACKTG